MDKLKIIKNLKVALISSLALGFMGCQSNSEQNNSANKSLVEEQNAKVTYAVYDVQCDTEKIFKRSRVTNEVLEDGYRLTTRKSSGKLLKNTWDYGDHQKVLTIKKYVVMDAFSDTGPGYNFNQLMIKLNSDFVQKHSEYNFQETSECENSHLEGNRKKSVCKLKIENLKDDRYSFSNSPKVMTFESVRELIYREEGGQQLVESYVVDGKESPFAEFNSDYYFVTYRAYSQATKVSRTLMKQIKAPSDEMGQVDVLVSDHEACTYQSY